MYCPNKEAVCLFQTCHCLLGCSKSVSDHFYNEQLAEQFIAETNNQNCTIIANMIEHLHYETGCLLQVANEVP